MRLRFSELALCVMLGAAVVVSGVWLVESKHEARQLFTELEELKREEDRLQVDWGRLQIEQSTWATHSRIESLARDRLRLDEPREEQIVMVAGPVP